MIGLKRGTVKLVEYNPKWEKNFAREAKKIKKALNGSALDIQHVGSTAIPGILAKPIIDISVTVVSLEWMGCESKLKEIGYELKQDDTRKERLFFTKGPEEKRTHHLHIGKKRSGYVEDMILFRDYLRHHREEAKQYSDLKKKLATKYSENRKIYTAKKEKFIQNVVAKVRRQHEQ